MSTATAMFTPIEDEETIHDIEAGTRTRGMTDAFFHNIAKFYKDGKFSESGKPFMVYLNRKAGDPFHGKKTDSLYATLQTAMNRLELKAEWRLIKRKDGEVSYLVIAKL